LMNTKGLSIRVLTTERKAKYFPSPISLS